MPIENNKIYFKNRLFLILTSCFAVDLFYLFVLKIGTNESFIHGGHFIYLIPLFIGWLYTSLSEKLKIILSSKFSSFIKFFKEFK